jgi:O-antigen ligase
MSSFPKSSSTVLSQLLAFIIPACVAVYWIVWAADRDIAIQFFRPAILFTSISLFVLVGWAPVTHAEGKLIAVSAALCAVLLIPSLIATNPAQAMQEWFKLLIIFAVTVMLCRALRYPATAKTFGASLVLASIVIGAFIVTTYLKNVGLELPTYTITRAFKGTQRDISLNAAAFECVFTYISGMCLLRSTRVLWSLGLVVVVISCALTGSRTPLAVLILSVLVLIILNALRSPRLLFRVGGMLMATSIAIGVAVAIAVTSSKEISAITEGRWELWSVALQKFVQQPVWGNGYQSAQDDSVFLAGGYHNEYLTALAEQGAVGFLAVMTVFWFLFRCCLKLAFRPSYTWHNGQWALFGCLLLLLRATVELPGLFGTAQGPADFLAYIFVAIVVSRESREEDYILSETRRPIRPSTRFSRWSHA